MSPTMLVQTLLLLTSVHVVYPQPSPNMHGTDDEQLQELINEYQRWRVEDSPEYGSMIGWHTLDDQLQEYTEEAFGNTVRNATLFLDRANAIDDANLCKQDKISLLILKDGLETIKSGYRFRKYGMYNPMFSLTNPLRSWKYIINNMPKKTIDQYENILARYRLIPNQFSQLIEMMKKAISYGTTRHEATLTGVLEYMNSHIVENVETSMFYTPFINMTDNIDAFNRDQLQTQAKQIIRNMVMPAIRNLTWFVETQYSPATRAEPGLSSLPGGGEAYAECLRWHTSTDMTPDQVHQLGLQEVERIRKEMRQIMIEDGFNGTLQEYRDLLYNQPDMFFQDSDTMYTRTIEIVRLIHKKLHLVINRIPMAELVVRPHDNPSAAIAGYSPGAIDGSTPGIYMISLFNPTSKPKFPLMSLTLHEAEPGHHTQISMSNELEIPVFRKRGEYRRGWATPFNWPVYNAYLEGWALYAESLGEDLGVYSNRYDRLGKLSWEAFRACRLVVDTGIHAFGWSKQEAVDYMYNNTMHSIESVTNEVNRYIGYPGQACSYKVGELVMQRLRREATQKLQSRFRLQDFNDEILSLGACPMWILEQHMKEWITNQMSSGSGANTLSFYTLVINVLVLCYYTGKSF